MLLPGRRRADGMEVRAIKEWVREALGTDRDVGLFVTELACDQAGCPSIETVVAVLEHGQAPRQWKLPKRMTEVTRNDIRAVIEGIPNHGIRGWRCPD